jgi:hypothetical protein
MTAGCREDMVGYRCFEFFVVVGWKRNSSRRSLERTKFGVWVSVGLKDKEVEG